LPVDLRVETPEEIANIIRARRELDLNMGMLVTVPVPADDEWPAAEAQVVIDEAIAGAEQLGITGKAVTPYLLQRVSELSGERSKKTNIALLLNNARLGAKLAQELAE
jgi:pseudouridine-5'-phosphate glycosidase